MYPSERRRPSFHAILLTALHDKRGRISIVANPKEAAHSSEDSRRQYVNFAFYKVDPAWRRLPAEERKRGKGQFIDAVKTFEPEMLVTPYSLVGIRGDCDFMLWGIGYELPNLQEMRAVRLATTLDQY